MCARFLVVINLAFGCLSTTLPFAGIAAAQEQSQQQSGLERQSRPESQSSKNAERAKTLLDQMQSSRSSDRRRASLEIRSMGIDAHPLLRQMVETGDTDTAFHAIELLRDGSKSSNESLAASAKQSLKIIADQDGVRSKMADDILNGVKRPNGTLPAARQRLRQIQMQFAQPLRQKTRIGIRTINGVRSIEVTINNRVFKFRDAGKGIEVERPAANGAISRATYQDVKEFKAKDPEAYRYYQSAGGDRGNGLGGIANPLAPNPLAPNPLAPNPLAPNMPIGNGGRFLQQMPSNQTPLPQLPNGPHLRSTPALPQPLRKAPLKKPHSSQSQRIEV